MIFPELFFTDRLRVDLFSTADAPFIISLLNSKGWIDGIGDRAVHSTADAEAFVFRINHTDLFRYWAVRLKETGVAIGMVSCMKREHLNDFDLGFAFLPESNGLGYAHEAAQKLLFVLKEHPQFHRVLAICAPSNHRSVKLLEKLDFRFENQLDSGGKTVNLFSNDKIYTPASVAPVAHSLVIRNFHRKNVLSAATTDSTLIPPDRNGLHPQK